jgi:hypothetical protein
LLSLGCGLLAVDLYGARARGLIPATAIDGLTYAGLSCALIAAINLLMSRIAPGAICAALVYGAILITGCGRIFLGLVAHYPRDLADGLDSPIATTMASLPQVLSVTGVVGLAAVTGLLLLRKASLPTTLPPALGECVCAAKRIPLANAAGVAVVLAELTVLTASPDIGTGVVLTIAAAPLVAYGQQPGRRPALLLATLMLIDANTAFVLGAGATTMEWFTLPPAVLMLAVGLLGWRDQSSWVFLGPGLLLGLVPSALIANSNDGALRLALVVAAAVAITLLGVQLSLQAPFVIGTLFSPWRNIPHTGLP